MGHASKRRELLVGTDQRITSGPAATAAASRWRKSFKRKQAGYMAAPERFAETSDSSCTAGAVHTWPVMSFRCGAAVLPVLEDKPTSRGHRESGADDPGADLAVELSDQTFIGLVAQAECSSNGEAVREKVDEATRATLRPQQGERAATRRFVGGSRLRPRRFAHPPR